MIDGDFQLKSNNNNYAVLGAGVAYFLGFSLSDFSDPFTIYVPRRTSGTGINFANAFNEKLIYASGIFSVQQDFDVKYVIVPIDFARDLLEYKNEVTSIELGLDKNSKYHKYPKRNSRINLVKCIRLKTSFSNKNCFIKS